MERRRATEMVLSCAALSWGIWLLLPLDTFGASVAFTVLGQLGPEWMWGLLMGGAGLQGLWGAYKGSYTMRRWSLLVQAGCWLAIWCAFVLSSWRSTTTIHYIWWVVLCVLAYLRAGRNGVHPHQL